MSNLRLSMHARFELCAALLLSACGGGGGTFHPLADGGACGAAGQTCCSGTACNAGLVCLGGACRAPQGVDAGANCAPDCQSAHGSYYKYVIDHIAVPLSHLDYAVDLNGDGKVDNQLGNILGALTGQNISVQSGQDMAVASGSAPTLVTLQTADAALQNDPLAGVAVDRANPTSPPRFDGSDAFTVDNSVPTAHFYGALMQGKFRSNDPVTTRHPVQLVMKLVVAGGPIDLPVNGAEIRFTTGTDAASGAPGLLAGEIHGSIKNAYVQSVIIPQIAALLTADIQTDPTSPATQQIEQIFDTGGCGTAQAGDGVIDPCEVAQNTIIQSVLAPDVQIYDAAGNYAPNKANTNKDSLSLGVGFTAVRASF